MKIFINLFCIFSLVVSILSCNSNKTLPDKTGMLWYPFLEWQLENSTYDGNPFDLNAKVIFTHQESGTSITTRMYFDTNNTWKFRFTGTETGEWSFLTTSEDEDLNNLSGKVTIKPNTDQSAHGFIKNFGNKWGWQGTETAFVPQYVMGKRLTYYYDSDINQVNEERINNDIEEFCEEHGFTGFHLRLDASWFSICEEIPLENPDPRTYEVLETIIKKVHAIGGACHLWMWGSDGPRNNSSGDGPRGLIGEPMNEIDKRNLKYIAARLGPIPGWTLGYGIDTENGVATKGQLDAWKLYLEQEMGWSHFIGARVGYDEKGLWALDPRPPRPEHDSNYCSEISDEHTFWLGGDYIGYTSYRPLYERYREALLHHPEKPSFEEDRFRLRDRKEWNYKDYNEKLTVRGLWHSAMAGGVANIWGNLLPESIHGGSQPYNVDTINIKDQIKTYSLFIKPRFKKEMKPEKYGDAMILKTPDNLHILMLKENTNYLEYDFVNTNELPAVAIDTKKPYKEIKIGVFTDKLEWKAPHVSNWAVAVGDY